MKTKEEIEAYRKVIQGMNAEQFKQRMAQLPEPSTDLKPPYWEAWRLDLWRRVQTQDPLRFWEWPCVYHTMLVAHWLKPIDYELMRLPNRLTDVCSIPHFGPVDPLPGYPDLSMNLIHQAYHIHQWETATGRNISTLDTIVEFGGGYGAMALLCHWLGFRGRYIIYDLPEFSLLQEYYLSQFGILDKVNWNPKRMPFRPDLFMALYSLSEVEPGQRREFIPFNCKSFLFLYSGQWEKWDNALWFSEFSMETKLEWRHSELAHLPDPRNFYSIGW